MARTLWLDLETRSTTPIDLGTYRYAEDDSLAVVLFGYALDDEPARVCEWPLDKGLPDELAAALADEHVTCIAHNSSFDRACLAAIARRDADTPCGRAFAAVAAPERWKDSMVLALSCGLPGSLYNLCLRLKVPQDKAKDADGKRLLRRFCIPDAKGHFGEQTPLDADDWRRFVGYCRLDVEAMREVWRRTPKDNDTPDFWREWHLDQRINDRGILIDGALVEGCAAACAKAAKDAASTLSELTGGRVSTAGQRERILRELASLGVRMPDLQQSTVDHRLADPSLPDMARRILTARSLAGRSSVAKFAVLRDAVCSDGRLRGCHQFCGARTGRWSGRLFQPQNLPRGDLHGADVETAIAAFRASPEAAAALYDDVMSAASSCIRGCVIAPAGKRLAVADLSNIEGRTLAWLAGESWKVEAFRAFDRGEGPDIYKATYARTFGGRADDVTKPQRQIGKILELAMGYGGGVGAFRTFAAAYGTDMNAMAELTLPQVDAAELDDIRSAYARMGAGSDMSERVWCACEVVKRRWRQAHPATVRFWSTAEEAARAALSGLGLQPVGAFCSMDLRPGGLVARLPSGRCIRWPGASLPRRGDAGSGTFRFLDAQGWAETYGGRLVENLTQAVARDILAHGMKLAEKAGFAVVMHVHDELICEDTGRWTMMSLSRCMATVPEWAASLPLAAAGFTAKRYRKD